MLGIVDQLRYNGLGHSPATRTRRSVRMRVKLQLVLCSDEGREETITDVMTLNKNSQHIEHLGLTMAEQTAPQYSSATPAAAPSRYLSRSVCHLRGLWGSAQGEGPRQPLVSYPVWHL